MRGKALGILLLFSVLPAAGGAAPASPGPGRQYPPYPDSWEWAAAQSPPGEAFLDLRPLADGDVLIDYATADGRSSQILSFFGRNRFGRAADAFSGATPPVDYRFEIVLPDGNTVRRAGPPPCIRHLGIRLAVENAANRKLVEKTLLYLLDKPKRSRPPDCVLYPSPSYRYRVAILDPRLVPLADNTFLAADPDAGIVVRFNDRLETRSPLLGRRLFLVDPKALERFARRYGPTDTPTGFDWAGFHRALPGWLAGKGRTSP